jgi:hypothetical protein
VIVPLDIEAFRLMDRRLVTFSIGREPDDRIDGKLGVGVTVCLIRRFEAKDDHVDPLLNPQCAVAVESFEREDVVLGIEIYLDLVDPDRRLEHASSPF